MTKLPNGWEVKKLGEIAKITSGGTPSRSKNEFWENGSIPWVKIKDMKEDYIKSTEEFITDLGLNNSSAKLFPKGTLLYSIFATLGEVGILDINAATNQAIAGITIKQDDINTVFMMYYLKSIKNEVMKKGRGVAQNNLNISMLKELEVPLPPIEEQRKIVKILDEKFASIDESIRLAKVDLLSLDELWQSILNDSFNPLKSKLDNDTYTLPPTWKWEKLGDISTIVGGGTPSKNNSEFWENGTISWASVRDMNDDFILKTELSITQKGLECSSANLVDDRYVIIATRVGLGKVCLINNPISFNQDLKGVLPSDKLNKIFLFYYFKNIASYLVGMGIGATVKGIKLDVVKQIQIPLPPLKEQERIAKELESKAKTIKELKELYTKRLKDYEELKESLLDLAFKGGL